MSPIECNAVGTTHSSDPLTLEEKADMSSVATASRDMRQGWLAALLLRQPDRYMSRLAVALARLRALPRGYRRQLRRRAAVSAAGAALILALAGGQLRVPVVHAATISVADGEVVVLDNGICSLREAIINANDGAQTHDDCATGSAGEDTIELPVSGEFEIEDNFSFIGGFTGLPTITTDMELLGNNSIIYRDPQNLNKFRLMTTADLTQSGLDVTLVDVTLSGGVSRTLTGVPGVDNGHGGAIYATHTNLKLINATISGNTAGSGGGLYAQHGTTTVVDSVISDNQTTFGFGGGIYNRDGELYIYDSLITGNESHIDGGGLSTWRGTVYISDTTIADNYAGNSGGGIYQAVGGGGFNSTISLLRTTISENTAVGNGGGIHFHRGASLSITDSSVRDNKAILSGGGIYALFSSANDGITMTGSTLSGNESGWRGGGAYLMGGGAEFTNSTISGNTSGAGGGGLFLAYPTGDLTHMTISDNMAVNRGGGIDTAYDTTLTLTGSVVAGNIAPTGGEIHADATANAFSGGDNVLGDGSKTLAGALSGFPPAPTDITATSDGTVPTSLNRILAPLADNGGLTQTHALFAGSPALNIVPIGPPVDQRGMPRPIGPGFDGGAFEGAIPVISNAHIYVSTDAAGTVTGGLAYNPSDVLKWNSSAWSLYYDGAATAGNQGEHNVAAFALGGLPAGDGYLTFTQNGRTVPGISGAVDGMDIVRFQNRVFSVWFDGQDVGLNNLTNERIDGLHVLPGTKSPIGSNCLAYLLVSTRGTGQVTDHNGGRLDFRGEDVLGFCMTATGSNTAGSWHMVLDGSAYGLPQNSLDSLSLSTYGNHLYVMFVNKVTIGGVNYFPAQVYPLHLGTGQLSGSVFSASGSGLTKMVDALDVVGDLP